MLLKKMSLLRCHQLIKTKKGNSKGGLKKAENQRKRAKYKLCDLTPTNLRKMSEEERAEVNQLFNLDDLDYS